jgi:DnaJ like chaperone protein
VLDVPKSAADSEVKKAYRRLMSQHHPDKLVSKGLPEEMIKLANEKTQQIRKAYERIKASRDMR